jgi:hypothetical protein
MSKKCWPRFRVRNSTYLNGDKKFFFTFPTSEGSDLLSSHVMQTPTFISKLSDENVIFRLDVGKNTFLNFNVQRELEEGKILQK